MGLTQKIERFLKRGAEVDLSGENISSLSVIPSTPLLKTLNLSYVRIENLVGLKRLSNIHHFIADGSMIQNLAGFRAIRSVSSVSLRNTPVSKTDGFLLSLLIVCPGIKSLNGRIISHNMLNKASKFDGICSQLVNHGIMITEDFTEEDILEAKEKLGLSQSTSIISVQNENSVAQAEDTFLQTVSSIYAEHENCVQAAKIAVDEADQSIADTEVEYEAPNEEPQSLLERIASILIEKGFQLDQNAIEESVLRVVHSLCLNECNIEEDHVDDLQDNEFEIVVEEEHIDSPHDNEVEVVEEGIISQVSEKIDNDFEEEEEHIDSPQDTEVEVVEEGIISQVSEKIDNDFEEEEEHIDSPQDTEVEVVEEGIISQVSLNSGGYYEEEEEKAEN